MKNLPPRRERRAHWRRVNRERPDAPVPDGVDPTAFEIDRVIMGRPKRTLRSPWVPFGPLTPLQQHALAKRRAAGGGATLEVALGFNRAQRQALHSRKGSRTPTVHGRPSSTPAQSFYAGGRWNPFALRIEAHRRLRARVERHRRANAWWRRVGRLLRVLLLVAPVVLVRRALRRLGRPRRGVAP